MKLTKKQLLAAAKRADEWDVIRDGQCADRYVSQQLWPSARNSHFDTVECSELLEHG